MRRVFFFSFLNVIIKVDPRGDGEFLVILLPSSHRRNHSSALLHFRQPAVGLGVRASPRPLPLPRGGEAALPAFTAASPRGSVGLDPAGLPDPGPRGPGCAGTDQRSDPGQGGERDPVPAGRVPPSCCWHPAEGNAWGSTDKQGLHLEYDGANWSMLEGLALACTLIYCMLKKKKKDLCAIIYGWFNVCLQINCQVYDFYPLTLMARSMSDRVSPNP